MPQERTKAHESLAVGLLLSLVGGYLDAYTYILKDGVFANAQTGNVVLLAISLTSAEGGFLKYLFPLGAFILGIGGAELIRSFTQQRWESLGMKLVLGLEILILLALAFYSPTLGKNLTVILISFLAALQVQSFRKVKQAPYATTMITGNLRSGLELLFQGIKEKQGGPVKKAGVYALIILGFAGGAWAGALMASWAADLSLLVCCGLLALVLAWLCLRTHAERP